MFYGTISKISKCGLKNVVKRLTIKQQIMAILVCFYMKWCAYLLVDFVSAMLAYPNFFSGSLSGIYLYILLHDFKPLNVGT
jgi:hypothetical protein